MRRSLRRRSSRSPSCRAPPRTVRSGSLARGSWTPCFAGAPGGPRRSRRISPAAARREREEAAASTRAPPARRPRRRSSGGCRSKRGATLRRLPCSPSRCPPRPRPRPWSCARSPASWRWTSWSCRRKPSSPAGSQRSFGCGFSPTSSMSRRWPASRRSPRGSQTWSASARCGATARSGSSAPSTSRRWRRSSAPGCRRGGLPPGSSSRSRSSCWPRLHGSRQSCESTSRGASTTTSAARASTSWTSG
mmetsp:Transcript_51885/g.152948  ORF Transcript_51885/g.152948 Transcript_51885/m.152948 type:complete len:248 (+) Transcript_51885:162-905(+)